MARIARPSGCRVAPNCTRRAQATIDPRSYSAEIPLLTSDSGAARRWTVIASGLLLLALALVVIYTKPRAFLSPTALVVVAAIGFAALLFQLRFRRDLPAVHSPLWLNLLGVACALFAVLADFFHLAHRILDIVAFAAVVCFGISGSVILHAIRRETTRK